MYDFLSDCRFKGMKPLDTIIQVFTDMSHKHFMLAPAVLA